MKIRKKNHPWPMNLPFLEDRKYCDIQITHEYRKIYPKRSPTFSLTTVTPFTQSRKKGGSGDSPKE